MSTYHSLNDYPFSFPLSFPSFCFSFPRQPHTSHSIFQHELETFDHILIIALPSNTAQIFFPTLFFFIILLFYHCISPSLSLLDSFIRFIFFRVPLFFCSPVVMGTASEIVTCAKRPDWWFLFVSYF